MTTLKPRADLRKIFVGCAILGIILNFGFDFLAYQRLHLSDESGKEVTRTYESMMQLQRLDQKIDTVEYPLSSQDLRSVLKDIETLEVQLQNPQQRKLLQSLKGALARSEKEALNLLVEIIRLEDTYLQTKLQGDIRGNQSLERVLVQALTLDGLLILLLCAVFLWELKTRRHIENKLISSLNTSNEANTALRSERTRQNMNIKTTVHDLKNPLGSIHGYAELISDESNNPSVQEFSETIMRISKNSIDLVETLLKNPDDSNFKREKIDMMAILREVCRNNHALASNKNQTLIQDFKIPAAIVDGNKQKLFELFQNILSNAIKYSPFSKTIWIRCYQENAHAYVEIEDQGPGFTEQDKTQAFRYGQTLSAQPTGKETSTGYGLFTAKQIAELHRAKIQIQPTSSGIGSLIRFEIPLIEV